MTLFYRFTAVLAICVVASAAYAAPMDPSISINFGSAEPDGAGSTVDGDAGVFHTAVWNNFPDANSADNAPDPKALVMDNGGVSSPSSATVSWTSNNTWASTGRSEENNTAPPGDDRDLMTGYLDTSSDSVTEISVTGLDAAFTDGGYSVVVYMNGGVIGRGGQYTYQSANKISSGNVVDEGPFDGTYVNGENFATFIGLTDADFTISATPTTPDGNNPRAPINGIEIIAVVPEPSSIVLAICGLMGIVGLTRRRSS